MAFLLTGNTFRGETDGGAPLAGGLLYTYVSGTTTNQATYSDAALTTPNANPVVLNARGEAEIWLDPTKTYTLHLTTALGATVGSDVDDLQSTDGVLRAQLASTSAGNGAAMVGFDYALIPGAVNKVDWGVDTAATWVNVLRYIPVTEWATIRAGTSTTDLATYIQAAFSALSAGYGGTLFFPPGVYPVTTCPLVWNTGGNSVSISIKGSGQKATIIKKLGTTTTTVLPCTVTALNNGTFITLEDFTVQGISTCNGIDMTLFARFQTKNLGIIGCNTGMNSVACLIASHYDPFWQGNVTGFKCVHSGAVYPNLVSFYGGAVLQNTGWGFDFGDGDSIFVYGTDIELNGTTGNTGTGGAVCRSTLGSSSINSSVSFHGGWFEANFGNGLLVEANTSLSLSLSDCKFVNNEANNSMTCGAIRSLNIDNCNSTAFNSAYTIGAVLSLMIRGGSVWTLTNSAVSWVIIGLLQAGVTVKYRCGGSGLGLYQQSAERHNSGTGNISAATATATTLFTVSGSGPRMITVFACLGSAGVSYTSTGRFAWDGANLFRMGGENAANLALTASGANVQVTQISGVTQTVFYVSDVIG